MRINRRVLPALAAAVALSLPLAACGDSDGGGDGDSELVDFFVSEGAPRDEAECVAGELSEFDASEVIAAFSGDEAPSDAALAEALFAAVETCDVE